MSSGPRPAPGFAPPGPAADRDRGSRSPSAASFLSAQSSRRAPGPAQSNDRSAGPAMNAYVTRCGNKIQDALNELQRELDRDGETGATPSLSTSGSIDISVGSGPPHRFTLTPQHAPGARDTRVTVAVKRRGVPTAERISLAPRLQAARNGTRSRTVVHDRAGERDVLLERDLSSRHQDKLDRLDGHPDDADDPGNEPTVSLKRKRDSCEDDEEFPSASRIAGDVEALLAVHRDGVQQDTVECANHVHGLLRHWREQWRENNAWLLDHFSAQTEQERLKKTWMDAKFAELQAAVDGQGSYPIGNEARRRVSNNVLSDQVQWLEDCRRTAFKAHHEREEAWRQSSASFQDQVRSRQERFEQWVMTEMTRQGRQVSQLLASTHSDKPDHQQQPANPQLASPQNDAMSVRGGRDENGGSAP